MVMRVSAEAEIEYGMSCTRLGEVFDLDAKTVKSLLKDVEPDGDRNGAPFWRIASAAPFLVTPEGDIEQYLRKLKPGDLPAKFQKEFWTALNLRAKYYVQRGDLWATERVYEVVSSILKIVRSTTRLFVDELESNSVVTNKQRAAIQIEMDKMLAMIREQIKDDFKNYDPTRDHVEAIEAHNAGIDQLTAEDEPRIDADREEEGEDDWIYSL